MTISRFVVLSMNHLVPSNPSVNQKTLKSLVFLITWQGRVLYFCVYVVVFLKMIPLKCSGMRVRAGKFLCVVDNFCCCLCWWFAGSLVVLNYLLDVDAVNGKSLVNVCYLFDCKKKLQIMGFILSLYFKLHSTAEFKIKNLKIHSVRCHHRQG